MVDVSCPEKKAAEDSSLQDFKNYLEENFADYEDFVADFKMFRRSHFNAD